MTESNPSTPSENLAAKLKNLLSDELEESDVRWGYRKAASVLSFFDMDQIRPLEGDRNETAARESLLPESNIVYDDKRQPHWMLRGDSRRAALTLLKTEKNIKHALDVNPNRPDDPLQRMFEDYLFHRANPLENQTRQDLLCTLQVAEWLHGLVEGVPTPQAARQRLEMENFFSLFRFLAGDNFRGRETELSRLADYVGVMEPSSLSQGVVRSFRKIFSLKEKPPLVIYGPGGIGKSALVAKFILDHAYGGSQRFPFAYLDFDRSSISAEEPITLLIEALRQLEVQFPESSVSLKRLRESWMERTGNRTTPQRPQGTGEFARTSIDRRRLFLDEFAEEIRRLTLDDRPLLLVLDTFEEVQYRSRAFVLDIFHFLEALQQRIPTLRTVFSGRAPIRITDESEIFQCDYFEIEELALTAFDPEVAQAYLMSHGVKDPQLAKLIAAKLGGSPLTLKLAIDVLQKESAGTEWISNLKGRDSFLRRLDDETITARLFSRIVAHIHDQRVAKLALPGVLLRRITPELILDVLAEPGDVHDLADATELFNALSQEVALVTHAGDEALVYRPDLRTVLLKYLWKDRPHKVVEIHQKAVKYYEAFNDDVSRAEEIYHRLSLGIDRRVLANRWRDGLQLYLFSAIEELPTKAKAFLAVRLNVELDETVWKEADLEDWEIHAERRARDLLQINQPVAALAGLRQRNERTSRSTLPVIEREALLVVLTTMQTFFVAYHTTLIKRATMVKLYEAIMAGLRDWELPVETIISVRDILKLDRPEGEDNGTAEVLFAPVRRLMAEPSNTTSASGDEVGRGLRALIEMLNHSELSKAQLLFGKIHEHLTDLYGEYQKHAAATTAE